MSGKLIVIGGLPGTGKTSLAIGLARVLDAVHVRIDTIEQALRSAMTGDGAVGTTGYVVAHGIAADNLRLGRIVVADCVNPFTSTREAWRAVARSAGVAVVEVEVVCSDVTEHRRRVEARNSDIAGLKLPTWADVARRQYEPWDGEPIVIDTAQRSVAGCIMALHALLLVRERAMR
jgi:predicted kinase